MLSSGQGAIPDRRYSPQARERMNWCNSNTDSIVWMEEERVYSRLKYFQALFYLRSGKL